MKENKETQQDIGKLIGNDVSQVSRRLTGDVEWSFSDIEILCKHYNMDFYELFRKEK